MVKHNSYNYRPFKALPEMPLVWHGVWGDPLTGQLAAVRVVLREGESQTSAMRDEVRNSWPSR